MGRHFCSRSLSGHLIDMYIGNEGFQCTFSLGQSSCQVVTGEADGPFKREIYLGIKHKIYLSVRYILCIYISL